MSTQLSNNSRRPKRTWLIGLLGLSLGACAAQNTEDLTTSDSAALPSQTDSQKVSADHDLGFRGAEQLAKLSNVTTWFVELGGDPLVMGGDPKVLAEELDDFRRGAFAEGIPLRERRVFQGIVHGVTVNLHSDEVPRLMALGTVRRVIPVGLTAAPEMTHVSEPQLATALGMTGADVVQHELGFSGKGIRVGIIDTGIDLQHPDLAARVKGGFDFVGDNYNAQDPNSVPVPEPGEGSRPGGDDCGGHGTHVAGIVGAGGDPEKGGARGVAPGVEFHAYRIFGCEGSTNDDVIVAGIERAFEDGMDIVNLSLGSDNGFPDDFLSLALSRVLELGMIPVASAGNNGRSGLFTVGSPAAGKDVITVASFDNVFTRLKRAELSNGTAIGYNTLDGAPAEPTSGNTGRFVYVGRGCNADTYSANPSGQVALITRGACTFAEKYAKAVAAGATGVVIENNANGAFAGTLGGAPASVFGITVSKEIGASIRALLTAGTVVSIRWTGGYLMEPNPTGNLISSFSSYGPAPDLSMKPDIGAPGGFIRSTWPLERTDGESTGYAVLSGTSMSSPYVTGAVALLLEAHPDLDASRVRAVLQNTAEPKAWFGAPKSPDYLDSVHHQGAGMLRIDRAVLAKTFVTPSKLELGESQQGPFVTTIALQNKSNAPATYTLGNEVRALATYGDNNFPDFATGEASVTYSRVGVRGDEVVQTITVPAGGVRSLTVRIEAPADLEEFGVYGGYLTFTPNADSNATAVSVPYQGFKGDYQAVDVLSEQISLLGFDGEGLAPVDAGYAYSMREFDRPAFSLTLQYGIKHIDAELVPLDGNAWIKPRAAFTGDLLRRSNPGEGMTFSMETFDASSLPNGRYKIRVKMLKAGGDASNPAHTQVAESPWFSIGRTQAM